MHTHTDKTQENKSQSVSENISQDRGVGEATFQFADDRVQSIVQTNLQEMANNSFRVKQLMVFQKMADESHKTQNSIQNSGIIQKATYNNMATFWDTEFGNQEWFTSAFASDDAEIKKTYAEAGEQLPYVDFANTAGADPHVDPNVVREDGRKTIKFDRTNPNNWDADFYVGAMVHELVHIANFRKYEKHSDSAETEISDFANFHLPEPEGDERENGLAPNQKKALTDQLDTLAKNWEDLYKTLESEEENFNETTFSHLKARVLYGGGQAIQETDTVLFDISYYMEKKELTETNTFKLAKRMLKEANDRRNKEGQLVARVEAEAYWFQIWKY